MEDFSKSQMTIAMSDYLPKNHSQRQEPLLDNFDDNKRITVNITQDLLKQIKGKDTWNTFIKELRAQKLPSRPKRANLSRAEIETLILDDVTHQEVLSDCIKQNLTPAKGTSGLSRTDEGKETLNSDAGNSDAGHQKIPPCLSQEILLASAKTVAIPRKMALPPKPLGAILREAGLISASQIEVALRDQTMRSDLRLGEILALRGWLNQKTTDFFAEQWPLLLTQKRRRLGYYLMKSALLDQEQIQTILLEQQEHDTWTRFGTLAVLKGWLKPQTRDFFVRFLATDSSQIIPSQERYSRQTLLILQ